MKKTLMEILACPVCKGSLVLKVTEETGDEVVSGAVYCPKCEQAYPITDAIPNLLPPELRENT
ncbi:MAG: methytransferase partner Trm112 [Chloroflexota bacterium]